MAIYFSFPFRQQAAVGRVFVKKNGTDEVQIAYWQTTHGKVQWRTRNPGFGWDVYTLSASGAAEYVRGANQRYVDDAVRLAAKTSLG
jgi:hypothetical protein